VSKPEDGFAAVVALAWGLTKDGVMSRTRPDAGSGGSAGGPGLGAHDSSMLGPSPTALLQAAGKARALGTLAAVLSTVAFQREAEEEHRCGSCARQAVCVALPCRCLRVVQAAPCSPAEKKKPCAHMHCRHLCARIVYFLLTETLKFDVDTGR
jgi:hypothetical protein